MYHQPTSINFFHICVGLMSKIETMEMTSDCFQSLLCFLVLFMLSRAGSRGLWFLQMVRVEESYI